MKLSKQALYINYIMLIQLRKIFILVAHLKQFRKDYKNMKMDTIDF
jgi:hypothetical protein